jgi:hypothetical protein
MSSFTISSPKTDPSWSLGVSWAATRSREMLQGKAGSPPKSRVVSSTKFATSKIETPTSIIELASSRTLARISPAFLYFSSVSASMIDQTLFRG